MADVYYNENDAAAANQLRWLIAEGLLPGGWVDDRSIADVQPGDLGGFSQCHFFAGIGGWPLAALLAGVPADWPLWTGSCPCQPFSAAGRRQGADDPRHLWPHFFRLIDACGPARVVGEQVAGAAGYAWFDGVAADLGGAGYASRVIDIPAAAVDSPQIRQRLWWAALSLESAASGRREGGAFLGAPRSDDARAPDGFVGAGPMAGGPGGRRWRVKPVGGSEGRTASQGDDAGELASRGVDQVDTSRDGRGEREPELLVQRRRDSATGADGASLGVAQGDAEGIGRGPGLRQARPIRDGAEPAGPDGGSTGGAAQGRASGRRLEIRKLSGWSGGTPARWLDATGADDGERVDQGGALVNSGVDGIDARSRDIRSGRLALGTSDDRNGSWWSGADWIICHDGKARRVADATAPLLVAGFSGRLAAWRGVGNAICVPLATEVLKALMETDT